MLQEEIKRLRKRLQRAEMEREIFKKSTAYFARESQRNTHGSKSTVTRLR